MAKVYQTKTGKWGVDITIAGRRFKRIVGNDKTTAVKTLKDLLDMRVDLRKTRFLNDATSVW